MKKKICLSCLLLAASLCGQAQQRAQVYTMRPSVTLRTPLQGDSINMTGDKFQVSRLLKSRVNMDFDRTDLQTLQADTGGYVHLEKAEKDYRLYLLKTRIRAERFAKGTLELSTPVRMEVYVNGVSKQTKEQAEDSMQQVKPVGVSLRMEPETDYEVVIRLLAAAEDKLAPALKCEYKADKAFEDVPVHLDATMKRRYALSDTYTGKRVRGVSLSYDGRYLLTRYQESFDAKKRRTYTELTEVKSGRMLNPDLNGDLRWMPRSARLYRTANGRRGKDLWVYDPATQQEQLVATDLPDKHFTWAPTEEYLIYYIEDEGEKVEGPLKRLLHPDDRIPGARTRYQLAKYDLATGSMEQLTYGSHNVYLNDITRDGKKLLCSSTRPTITRCPFSESCLFEINLETLQADTLVQWDAYISEGTYSPDGTQLLVTGSPSAFGGVGKNCGAHPIANDFDTQAYLVDKATGKVDPITRDFNPTVSLVSWNPTDGCIYFNTTDEDCQHIYRYTPSTRRFDLLPLQEDVISQFSLPDGNPSLAAYSGGGSYSAGVAYLYDMRKQTSRLWANPLAEKLEQIELAQLEEWNFTAADGTLVKGQICLPPAFDATRKYPLIVYYYGGTTPTTKGIGSPYSPQVFAARDYVVYVVQPSGAIGYGQEYSARHVNAWGDYTADEIIEGTRKFCEAHPFVDARKVGCVGASYGGFMTEYLQTKTDLFAAAVSHAGISNVTSYWGEGYWGYSYNAVAAADSYPWSHPELFTKHGSLFNADKINTPLLLLHGTADNNVPVGESIQLYNALKILGKEVEFVTVDGEDHYISDLEKRTLWHNTLMAWFARWLQDSPAWWDDLYPARTW